MEQTVEEKLTELLTKSAADFTRYRNGDYRPAFEEWKSGMGWAQFTALYLLRYGEALSGLQIVQTNDEE